MRFHKTLTVLLIDLPFRLRLGIVVLAYLLCLAMFALVFLPSHNGSILAIPLALSSWMFKRRGALIGLGCTLLALVVLNSLSVGGIVWPPALALTFLSGSLALLVEAVIISLLRQALDMAQALNMSGLFGVPEAHLLHVSFSSTDGVRSKLGHSPKTPGRKATRPPVPGASRAIQANLTAIRVF